MPTFSKLNIKRYMFNFNIKFSKKCSMFKLNIYMFKKKGMVCTQGVQKRAYWTALMIYLRFKKKSKSIRPLVIEISRSKVPRSLQKVEITDMKVDSDGCAKIQNPIWCLPGGSNRFQTVRTWLQIIFLGFPCCGGSHNSKNS